MKFRILAILLLLGAVSFNAQAQLKPSSEPRPQMDQRTGEVILLPAILKNDKPAPVLTIKEKKQVRISNLSQSRINKFERDKNGFYTMAGATSWSSGIRLNSYGYTRQSL